MVERVSFSWRSEWGSPKSMADLPEKSIGNPTAVSGRPNYLCLQGQFNSLKEAP